MPIPAGSRGTPARLIDGASVPFAHADTALPRSPFILIRSAAELDSTWRLAGGAGAAPKVDFARSSVLVLRLTRSLNREDVVPLAHTVDGTTQIVLPAATPRHVGGAASDHLEFYEVSIAGGPVSRVRYAP